MAFSLSFSRFQLRTQRQPFQVVGFMDHLRQDVSVYYIHGCNHSLTKTIKFGFIFYINNEKVNIVFFYIEKEIKKGQNRKIIFLFFGAKTINIVNFFSNHVSLKSWIVFHNRYFEFKPKITTKVVNPPIIFFSYFLSLVRDSEIGAAIQQMSLQFSIPRNLIPVPAIFPFWLKKKKKPSLYNPNQCNAQKEWGKRKIGHRQ